MFPPMTNLTERTRIENERQLLEAETRLYAQMNRRSGGLRSAISNLRCWFAGFRAQLTRRSETGSSVQATRPC